MASWLLLFLLHSLNAAIFVTATAPCYYPNGDISTEDVPCRSSGGATICCPLNWQCMSDGLCYLANAGYYERHTCSDNSWPNTSCPRICTHDMSAGGNEAMLWCASGEWCCDGNRSWNCCNTSGTDFFALPAPHPFAFISVTPSVSTSGGPATMPTTTASSSSSPSNTSSPTAQTSVIVTTGNNGATKTVTTVVISSSGQPAATSSASTSKQSNSQSHASNTAIVVGLAIGIPLICTLGTIAVYVLYRHYRHIPKEQPTRPPSPPTSANYQPIMPGTHAPELAGYPVAETKSGRESELYGSEAYLSPTLSPSTNSNAVASPPLYGSENPKEKMAHIPEEPQELWGGYVPYRPPMIEEEPEEDDGVVSPVTEAEEMTSS